MKKGILSVYAIVAAVGIAGFVAANNKTGAGASPAIDPTDFAVAINNTSAPFLGEGTMPFAGIAPMPYVINAGCSTAKTPAGKILCAVQEFETTLTPEQLTAVQSTYEKANAIKWSNLPCVDACHIGLKLSTLTDKQRDAALTVVAAATGTAINEGYNEITQIMAADNIMKASPAGAKYSYSSGNYFISFVGTPSATGTWQLQFGGHHLAVNQTFSEGKISGSTPYFEGVEPRTFVTDGKTYAPMADEQASVAAMIGGLDSTQLAAAKLSRTFNDVIIGPRANGQFPATKVGLPVSTLNVKQKALIIAAMKRWVLDIDDKTGAEIIATYTKELNDTYIAYSGTGTFTKPTDYVRIDGPGIWLELVVQTAVNGNNEIHFHTVWRDHKHDYGNNFTF